MPNIKTPLEVASTTLKAYIKLSETSGNRADSSGNSNTFTDNNTVTYRDGFLQNYSAYFNSASSEYLSILDASQTGLDPYDSATGKYTIFCRMKPYSLSAMCFYSKYIDGSRGFILLINTSGGIDVYINSGTLTASSPTGIISAETWNDVAVVMDSVNDKIYYYVNGFLMGSSSWTGTFLAGCTAENIIGAYKVVSTSSHWNGQIESLACWADALTAAEINSLSGMRDVFGLDTGGEEHLRSSASLNVKMAQSFDPKTTGYFEQVIFSALKNNSPTGNMWVTIETDSGGAPSGVAVATSEYVDVSILSTSVNYPEIAFRFLTPPQLTAGTTYWIVIQGDYTVSSTVGIRFQRSSGGAGNYTDGGAYTYNGTSWSAISTNDFKFRLTRVMGTFIDSHFTEAGTNDYGEFDSDNNNQRYAQNIKFTSDKTIKGIAVWMTMFGSPSGTAVMKIYSNSGGSPNTLLGTATAYNRNKGYKTGTPGTRANGGLWYFEFSSSVTLSANTEYWISIESSSGGSGANYHGLYFTSGSGYTATYDMLKYNSGAWSTYSAGYDMQFALFGEIASSVQNIPVIGRKPFRGIMRGINR